MKKLIAGLVLAAAALTGCGGSTCSDLEDGYNEFREAYKPCAASGESLPAFNANACDEGIDSCTDSEKDALADFASCLKDDVDECNPSNTTVFQAQVTACLAKVTNVGENCGSGL